VGKSQGKIYKEMIQMKKRNIIILVENQKEILGIRLKQGFISKDEYDKEIKKLKPYSVGVLLG
jgi:hypothetical protein